MGVLRSFFFSGGGGGGGGGWGGGAGGGRGGGWGGGGGGGGGGSPGDPCYPSCPTPSVTPSSSPGAGGETLSTEFFSPGKVEVRGPGSSLPFTGGDYAVLAFLAFLAVGLGALVVRRARVHE